MAADFPAQRASDAEMFPFDDVIMIFFFEIGKNVQSTLQLSIEDISTHKILIDGNCI